MCLVDRLLWSESMERAGLVTEAALEVAYRENRR